MNNNPLFEGRIKPTTTPSLSSPQTPSTSPSAHQHNNKHIAILILPSTLLLLLKEVSTSIPIILVICCFLVVYSFDLCNFGKGTAPLTGYNGTPLNYNPGKRGGSYYTLLAIWISWLLVCIVIVYDILFSSGEAVQSVSSVEKQQDNNLEDGEYTAISSNSSSSSLAELSFLLLKCSMYILLLFNTSIWSTLQFKSHKTTTAPKNLMFILERMLVSTLPIISSVIVSYFGYVLLGSNNSSGSGSGSYGSLDSKAKLIPYYFVIHLLFGIYLVGLLPSSINKQRDDARDEQQLQLDDYDESKKKKSQQQHINYIIQSEGRYLSYLLVFLPSIIHFALYHQRLSFTDDSIYDFILVVTIPYLLHYLIVSKGLINEYWKLSLPSILQPTSSTLTTSGYGIPSTSLIIISSITILTFQHQYIVPICIHISYIINDHDTIISIFKCNFWLSVGSTFGYISYWFYRRTNTTTNEYLLGEYHEDTFQLLLALTSIFYSLSVNPKLQYLPGPMLLVESVALWLITKQLRYAILTCFVIFTFGTVVIIYRLTFLTEYVTLLPGSSNGVVLKKFADLGLYCGMYLTLIIGLIYRAPGGYASKVMKQYDVIGICLATYSLLLVIMEYALLNKPMPLYSRDSYEIGRVSVYTPSLVYLTGLLMLCITWHVKRQKLVKDGSTIVTVSISLGKMLAVLINESSSSSSSLALLYLRWSIASLLITIICFPYLLEPVHTKMSSSRRKSMDASAKPGLPTKDHASLIVVIYCAVLLPSVIISSVKWVIEPLVGLLTGDGSEEEYQQPKLLEIIGYSASLWGVSVLSMINHFLPNGGGEVWRKVSAFTFILGLFVSFASTAFPGVTTSSSLDTFQSISSLDVEDDDTATGGWGLVSAFLAILLAMLGPLELKEIKDSSGRRDTRHLLRLMIFGLMFGCGISWFITRQTMSNDIFIPIFVTTFSCMAMSCLGTVASIMGYFLECSEFAEVEQIANIWAGVAFPVFFVISSVSLSAHARPFGIGGWASTYLSVCGLLAGAFCIMVRLRKEKNSTTRGYGNMSCVISWLCAIIVVYGRYGVAGVGVVGTTSVAGIPASVLGTLLCSPILLLLEGEGVSGGKTTYQVISTKSKKNRGLVLSSLSKSNWYVPLLAGTLAVFTLSTCYAIFLRGFGLSKFSLLFGTDDQKINTNLFGHGINGLEKVERMAKNSIVHTRRSISRSAAALQSSGIWTSTSITGPVMHIIGLCCTLPSLQTLIRSWQGKKEVNKNTSLMLPLNVFAVILGQGIPSLIAMSIISLGSLLLGGGNTV